jgi:hypothetical protein
MTDVEAIPGVVAWPTKIVTPENAVAVVRAWITRTGVPFSIDLPPDKIRETIKDARRAMPMMRPEVAGFGKFPDYLTPYQARGLAAILKMPRGSGMAFWAAGSGKTLLAILWALAGVGRVVVVTKAAVKYQWAGEVAKFTFVKPRVLDGASVEEALTEADTFVILSYEILPAWIEEIERWAKGFATGLSVVYDESQKVSSRKRWEAVADKDDEDTGEPAPAVTAAPPPFLAGDNVGDLLALAVAAPPAPVAAAVARPKVTFRLNENIAAAAWRLSNLAARALDTTATPMRDRRRNLWAQLDLVHPRTWGNYWTWAKRYCDAHEGTFGGMDDTGRSNDEELRDRLAVVTHRVTFAEANANLPPRRRNVVYIPIKEQIRSAMTNDLRAVAKSGDPTAIREALLLEASARKRAWLLGRLDMAVEDGLKVVAFTGRRKDCDELIERCEKRYAGKALVTGGHGGHPAAEREARRVCYMEAKGPALLIGTTDAWGEGLNLQDSDKLFVTLLPYTPGAIIQLEGRVVRLGQTRPVEIIYGVAEGTIDERIATILLTKLPSISRVVDQDEIASFGRELSGVDDDTIVTGLVNKLLGRAA